ncbi:TetR family transcriptional regulator [Sphingopyxis sp.]|uniref:TetR family transcriptional regulator n=1 Tax=Sphingopyxis sp. TaxID=1908224 RepID=UPI002B4A55C8|nr:TetR family transcriptional regulator [Sphingopyxis sp.]
MPGNVESRSGAPRAATATRILEAARALMTEEGLLEVSLAEISRRARTNVALVSYYFGSREGLMLALAQADAARALRDLERLLGSDLCAAAKLEMHIKALVEAYYARPYLHRLLQKLLREGSAEVSRQIGDQFVAPVAQARRRIIAQGIADGEFRDVDARFVSLIIDGACAHLFSSAEGRRAVIGHGRLDRALVDNHARTVADLVTGSLRPQATSNPRAG